MKRQRSANWFLFPSGDERQRRFHKSAKIKKTDQYIYLKISDTLQHIKFKEVGQLINRRVVGREKIIIIVAFSPLNIIILCEILFMKPSDIYFV